MIYDDFMSDDDNDEYQEEINFIMNLRGDEIDTWWGNLSSDEQERAQGLIHMAEGLLKMEQALDRVPMCLVLPENRSFH